MPMTRRPRLHAALRSSLRALSPLVVPLAAALAGWLPASAQAFEADSLVRQKCSGCHAPDAQGRLARIEEMRTTPEEWTVIVDRMRRLHGVKISTADMDQLLKELASTKLLTPQEQTRVSYLSLWHNAQQMEDPAGKDEERFFATCVRCHSAGKVYSYRMTPKAWAKVRDTHLYTIPTVVFQLREMRWIDEADAMLGWLAGQLPYDKPWTAPATRLDGRWGVFGWQPGRGAYRGQAQITDTGKLDYRVSGSITHADGLGEDFRGEATLYGGYALRTRTVNNGLENMGAFIVEGDRARGEWHLPAPDFRTARATWLRDDGSAKIARVLPGYLLAGEKTTLTVEGLNLPEVRAADISFGGAPVKVLSARRIAPDALQIVVQSSGAKVASAALSVKGIAAPALTLAPRIDHIAITPETGRARVSVNDDHPAEGVQFEAIAYAREGKRKVALGPVPASFQLAEEKTREDDDDMRWLGAIQESGNYVPLVDFGSNPTRGLKGENSGYVKVLAQYRRGKQTYKAQAHLAVTLPDLIGRLR